MKNIISASYKNDIPAFESEWFFDVLQNGVVDVPSKHGVRKVSLKPEDVYCFVFWTKNVSDNFMNNMNKICSPFYFQWTITGYGKYIEPNLPDKEDIIERFQTVSDTIGSSRVIWRYDPILISDRWSVGHHKEVFASLCSSLKGYTSKCVISFMDEYGKIEPLVKAGVMRAPYLDEINELSQFIGECASKEGISVQTCSEGKYDLTRYGIIEGPCIDAPFIESEFGINIPDSVKEPNSFRRCLCSKNTDIGRYHTCKHGCKYCYAQ